MSSNKKIIIIHNGIFEEWNPTGNEVCPTCFN